jgi:hypothetical protein
VLDQGFYFDAPPSEAGEQREVRPTVEGQGSKAPAAAPPHEAASLLMQPEMLGDRDLGGSALDQYAQVFAGEPTNLVAPTLSLRVELRPVDEASGRRVEEPKQPAWRAVVASALASSAITPP